MKRFNVTITSIAESELESAYLYIFADSPDNAAKWRIELLRMADSLELMPQRCGLAPESESFQMEVRQMIFGNYRLLFTINDQDVVILHVRHASQKRLDAE